MAVAASGALVSHTEEATDSIALYVSLDDLTSKASGKWEAMRVLDVVPICDVGALSSELRQIANCVETLRLRIPEIVGTLRAAGAENPETEVMVKLASASTLREDFLACPAVRDAIVRQIEITQAVFRNTLTAQAMTSELRAFAVDGDPESKRPFSINLAALMIQKGLLVKTLDSLRTANLALNDSRVDEMLAEVESQLSSRIDPFIAECKADPARFRSEELSSPDHGTGGGGGSS